MPTDITLQANISPNSPARPTPVKTTGVLVVDHAQTPGAAAESSAQVGQAHTEQLKEAVDQLSSYVQNVHRNLNFSIDESSGRVVIKVVDSESEEVIRQIPPEEMLALARRLSEMTGEQARGLLMQSKA